MSLKDKVLYSFRVLRRGQAMAEYLILTAIIAVGAMAIVQILGKNINAKLSQVSDAIGGHRSRINGVKAQSKHFKVHDMNDFNEALQDNNEDN